MGGTGAPPHKSGDLGECGKSLTKSNRNKFAERAGDKLEGVGNQSWHCINAAMSTAVFGDWGS